MSLSNATRTNTVQPQRHMGSRWRNGRLSHRMLGLVVALTVSVLHPAVVEAAAFTPSITTTTSNRPAFTRSIPPTVTAYPQVLLGQQQSTRSTRLQYSNLADPPTSSFSTADDKQSFEARMRQLVMPQQQSSSFQETSATTKQDASSSTSAPASLVTEVTSLLGFKNVLEQGREEGKVVVVRFYAPWCRACKAVEAAYQRLAREHANDAVQFVQIPMQDSTKVLFTGLGILTMPYAHVYHPTAGLVEELKMSRKHFHAFAQIVQTYADQQCDLPSRLFLEAPYERNS